MGSSAWSIWPSLMLDALPDATIKRFASPPVLKLPVKKTLIDIYLPPLLSLAAIKIILKTCIIVVKIHLKLLNYHK